MINLFRICVIISTWLFFVCPAFAYQPFPDTGQTMCYDASNNAVPCDTIQPGDPYYGQDAHYQPRLTRSYTKLGHGGTVLADNALHVDDDGPWIMTRDNITGLIWEVKTIANRSTGYSWANAENEFIAGLNSSEFGGFADWRLPDIKELSSLINAGMYRPSIDSAFFPNTMSSDYWSSTSNARDSNLAWFVLFNNSYVIGNGYKPYALYVRAVRSGPTYQSNLVDNFNGTVTDTATGLMWQKEPTISKLSWQRALEYAENLTLAGFSDWRLPNRNELQTLVDYTLLDTSFDPKVIYPLLAENTVSNNYWSSTTNTNGSFLAYYVYFGSGAVSSIYKSYSYYVRAVRGGISESSVPNVRIANIHTGVSLEEMVSRLI